MSKSQETWSKKEREKKKQQKKKEKEERKQERKTNAGETGKSFDEMLAYIDENGNLSSTPPDPRKKIKVKAEDMIIGVPKQEDLPQEDLVRNGKVTFFNQAKGFGFIKDDKSQESVFVHVNNASGALQENDKVSYEVEMGQRGPMATNVKLINT